MSQGQMAVVKMEFMVNSAMSLTLNGVSCSSCMKSSRGPDHPVDFSPIKAIRLIVHQLTNKKPTVADFVVVVLQGSYNRATLFTTVWLGHQFIAKFHQWGCCLWKKMSSWTLAALVWNAFRYLLTPRMALGLHFHKKEGFFCPNALVGFLAGAKFALKSNEL